MSRVKFMAEVNGRTLEVLGGWDRPLREFFLTILHTEGDDAGEALWSTTFSPSPLDSETTRHLREKLISMGISAPIGFWEAVELREGNVSHRFDNGVWHTVTL